MIPFVAMPFGGLGWPEIVVILVLVLIFFGPKRLPELAESVGKSLKKFKAATRDASDEVKREMDDINRELKDDPKDD